MRQIIDGPRFALVDVILVMLSGAIWMTSPAPGPWIILIALLPWMARLVVGRYPFQRTRFDWLIFIFLITAWVAYWAAYDKASAWNKICLIVLSVLLYYALASQPKQNLASISFILFGVGVGTSLYFFLTHDFTATPIRIASWWTNVRPQLGWNAIHHGYISGIVVITTLFSLYGILEVKKISSQKLRTLLSLLIFPGLGIITGALIFTVSRGIWLAVFGAIGTWILWKILTSRKLVSASAKQLFPVAILICLTLLVVFVYLGPASSGGGVTQSDFGRNTRSELFLRGAYFLEEYPIIGGGLNSFPGLYSQYLLVIPYFYFANSHNLFLDVGIEQGLIGGLAFLLIYIGSIWFGSQAILKAKSPEMRLFNWVSLFALVVAVVHGMLYDYLYNGMGTFLLFLPVGAAMIGSMESTEGNKKLLPTSVLQLKALDIRFRPVFISIGCLLVFMLILNAGRISSAWYANLGAVQMSKVELVGFPSGQWADSEIVSKLGSAENSLLSSLEIDPTNRTANHRLGLISMLRGDFETAVGYLEVAHAQAPDHRGIVKSLAYCYVWLGDMGKALELLPQIPEAVDEMGVYAWWWGLQGRSDLSRNAAIALTAMIQ